MVQVEAVNQQYVDGGKPCETCHTVKDATNTTLLARQTCQLAVGTVQNVGNHQQHNGDDVHHQAPRAIIVETATGKESGTGGTDNHRPDSHRVGVNVETVESQCAIITERTDDMEVKPVFRL